MLNITCKGGDIRQVAEGTTIDALCRDISMGLYRAACAAKLNAISIQLTQLRRERRRLLEHDDIEDAIGRLHQTADTIKAGPEHLDTFDEDLFEELVEGIVAESQTRIRFRLHGGIELAEEVGRAKR